MIMKLWFGKKAGFYSTAALLNLAVGVMFYTVNITPTSVSATTTHSPRSIPPKTLAITQGLPTHIILPSVDIDLPVQIGSYNPEDQSWSLDMTSAYYADVSVPINNSNGTTLIYGHAQSSIFETLPQVQPGAEAIVYTNTGYAFHYQFSSSKEVLPTDVSVFTSDGAPQLVLQTCIGVYSELRGLYTFKLMAVERL